MENDRRDDDKAKANGLHQLRQRLGLGSRSTAEPGEGTRSAPRAFSGEASGETTDKLATGSLTDPTEPSISLMELPVEVDGAVLAAELEPAGAVETEADPVDGTAAIVELEADPIDETAAVVEMDAEPLDESEPTPATANEPPPVPRLSPEGPGAGDVHLFYQREARALAAQQPEKAALMYLHAARAAEEMDAGDSSPMAQAIDAALAIRPECSWLLAEARRLFMQRRLHDRALDLGSREVDLGGGNVPRARVLQESAAVQWFVRRDAKAALELLDRAAALQPGDPAILAPLLSLRLALRLDALIAEGLEKLAATLTPPRERGLYLFSAGTVRDALLDQLEAAESDYRAAAEADPENLPAVMALAQLYERRGMWNQLAEVLERQSRLVGDANVEARLLQQAGSLHLDRTGDLEAAARDLGRACQIAPPSHSSLQRLAYVHEARGRVPELIAALRSLLELTLEVQGRAALFSHIAWLHQTKLNQLDEAAQAYRAALREMPSYLPALQALSSLYRQREQYDQLLEICYPEIEGSLPARARAVRCLEMAEILHQHLGRTEQAVRCYERALELDPGLQPAFQGLTRLLRAEGQMEPLADLLAVQAGRCKDVKSRNHLLLELAQIQAGPLAQTEQALATLEQIGEPDRTRSVGFLLLEMYQRTGRHADRVSFLLEMAKDTQDPTEAQGLRLEAAGLLESLLQENNRALEVYRQILQDDPLCAAALRGAGRIFHKQESWNELTKLYYNELKSAPERPDAAILLCRIARILEENLGQVAAAAKAYSRALTKDPACTPALSALERLVRNERRWEDLVQVLQSHAAARMDHAVAAEALSRAAEVADCHLNDLERAATLYLNAQALNPGSPTARHGLVRVYRRKASWQALANALAELAEDGRASADDRGMILLDLARVRELRLGQPPDLSLYRRAAEGKLASHLSVELTRAMRSAAEAELPDWLAELGRSTEDATLAAAHLLESAYRRELGGEGEEARGTPLEALRLAHQRRPEELCIIWSLERALLEAGEWAELAVLREKEARLDEDPAARGNRLLSSAEAFFRAGHEDVASPNAAEAERLTRECLALDPRSLPALRLQARLAERREAWADLATACDRAAESCADLENRLQQCLRAADLWSERLGDSTRALASLAPALADRPGEPGAFARAERLLRATGKFEELSRLYRRRIRATEEQSLLVELMRRHARLLRDELDDAGQAIAQLAELLTLAPADAQALQEISDLLVAQKRWSDAAARLAVLEEHAPSAETRHRTRLRQADLWLHHLHEPRRAQEILGAALAEKPEDLEARKQMAELCVIEGNWEGAKRILETVATDQPLELQAWALMQLSEVARLGLRDEDLARRYEGDLLRSVVGDAAALGQVVEHYRRRKEQERFIARAEQYLVEDHLLGSTAPVRAAIARVLLDDLGEPARALQHLQQSLQQSPDHLETRLLLARVHEKQSDPAEAARAYRTILEADLGCAPAYRGLARASERLGAHATVAAAAGVNDLLGAAEPEETALLKGLEGIGTPAGRVDLVALPLPDGVQPLERLMNGVFQELAPAYPRVLDAVLSAEHPVTAACQRLARAVGVESVLVAVDEGIEGAVAGLGQPVPLAVSPALAESPGNSVFRFWVGRALCSSLTGGALLEQLADEELLDLGAALGSARVVSSSAQQLRRALSRVLPRKVRKQLEPAVFPSTVEPWVNYRAAEQERADRVGLLLSRNPRAGLAELARAERLAMADLARSPRLSRLVRFVVSDVYARSAAALWA